LSGGVLALSVVVIAWLAASHADGTNRARTASAALTLSQLAGQRVVYAYSGHQPPSSLLSVIRAGEAAGVVLFAPNVASTGQIRAVIQQMQKAALASPVHRRLLILTDQEGGEVRRLPGAPLLSEKQIGGSLQALLLAGAAGRGAGTNLAGAGVNVNLAPVLDVFRTPGNFIDLYQRSYSSNPIEASSLGAAFIRSQQASGVAATAKHFPGLGAATQNQDTDLAPVILRVPLATLRSVDERPFRMAIAAGVKLVMVSWAIYPALDRTRPAGLSQAVVQRELRGRLGFRGVTISDGIGAGAVTPFGSLGQRAVMAAAAGDDLILASMTNQYDNTPRDGITVLHALTAALAAGQLNLGAARQAAARVLALRSSP
jgi:beta-N-acetylhexosaminidase